MFFYFSSNHLLGQIIVDDEGMFAVVSEILSHGAAGVGSQVLQRSGIRSSSRHHDGVLHGISVSESLHKLSHRGPLLTNSDIDTVQLLLLISSFVEALLVDDGVDGDGSFSVKTTKKLFKFLVFNHLQ